MTVSRDESYWIADADAPLDPRPVGAVLRAHAASTPGATALSWVEGRSLRSATYLELLDMAEQMAARLRHVAGRSGRVAIAATAGIDWLVAEYGAALAGTPLVPMNPAFTDAELTHILAVSTPAAVLADSSFRGSELLSRLRGLASSERFGPVFELGRWRELEADHDEPAAVDPASPFLVQFTSGTTGRPKGAVLSHRAALNCASLSMQRLGGGPDDVWLNVLPMHHVGGSVSVTLAVLAVGASMVIVPQFEPGLVLELIERAGATIFGGVPTMLLAMLDHPRFRGTDTSSLRFTQVGGSVVAPALIARIERELGTCVCNAYGQSESPNALMTSPDDDVAVKAETVGTPLPHRDVRIADSAGATVPFGVPGELLMRSPLTMDGYLGADTETPALDADGWLHTGDLCSMDARGVIRIHGRIRDVIIRGGENIYPAEIEDVMLRHPALADIVVIGVADERWGEVPVGVYRSAVGHVPEPEDLERFARASLASFKVPRRWIEVHDFPLTASGKVKKHELRSRIEAELRSAGEL